MGEKEIFSLLSLVLKDINWLSVEPELRDQQIDSTISS